MSFRKLIQGFRDFQNDYFHKDSDLFQRLVNYGQSPKVMMIACSDSRIDPAIITKSEPGDLFSVRNIAALVDPNDDSDHRGHATSAAVEYAVKVLKVEHIVILGHALCGGIQALAKSDENLASDNGFIARWIAIGIDARDKVRKFFPGHSSDDHARVLEQTSILVSLNNLMTYPWVKEAVRAGTLKLHGWYFDISNGRLLNYNPQSKSFDDVLVEDTMSAAMEHPACVTTDHISVTCFLDDLRSKMLAEGGCGCATHSDTHIYTQETSAPAAA